MFPFPFLERGTTLMKVFYTELFPEPERSRSRMRNVTTFQATKFQCRKFWESKRFLELENYREFRKSSHTVSSIHQTVVPCSLVWNWLFFLLVKARIDDDILSTLSVGASSIHGWCVCWPLEAWPEWGSSQGMDHSDSGGFWNSWWKQLWRIKWGRSKWCTSANWNWVRCTGYLLST